MNLDTSGMHSHLIVSEKKRTRVTQACVQCRKKKIKCNGIKPACQNCQDATTECLYSVRKMRGPRKGYVRHLEERVSMLEQHLNFQLGSLKKGHRIKKRHLTHRAESTHILDHLNDGKFELTQNGPPYDNGHWDKLTHENIFRFVDLYFTHIHAAFPFVHRTSLMDSISNGTVSIPLLLAILAIGARYSTAGRSKDHPSYQVGERFYAKAVSLIDHTFLEPTIENLQFWGVMACLAYGSASGSQARSYGGMAFRICQVLELSKEKIQKTPVIRDDGSIDIVAMSLRRHLFWSCICFDKLLSAGTGRPQCFDTKDNDTMFPTTVEISIIRNSLRSENARFKAISGSSLNNFSTFYLTMVLHFGDIIKSMSRAQPKSIPAIWPPVVDFFTLDARLRAWKSDLPDRFQFTAENLDFHKENAAQHEVDIWLAGHALWFTSIMVLHRGSLAYSDLCPPDVARDVYCRIQGSITTCQTFIDDAIHVFEAIKALCGLRSVPYLGFDAYILSTVLMTSVFSKTPDGYRKSNAGLRTIFDVVENRKMYWPLYERIAHTTKGLLIAHMKLYDSTFYKHGVHLDKMCQQQLNEQTQELYVDVSQRMQHNSDVVFYNNCQAGSTLLNVQSTNLYPSNEIHQGVPTTYPNDVYFQVPEPSDPATCLPTTYTSALFQRQAINSNITTEYLSNISEQHEHFNHNILLYDMLDPNPLNNLSAANDIPVPERSTELSQLLAYGSLSSRMHSA